MDVTFSLVTPTSVLSKRGLTFAPHRHHASTRRRRDAVRDVGRYRAYPGQSNNDNGLKTSTRDTLMQISAINPRDRNAGATIASVSSPQADCPRLQEARRTEDSSRSREKNPWNPQKRKKCKHSEHRGCKKLDGAQKFKKIKDNQSPRKDSKNRKQQGFKDLNLFPNVYLKRAYSRISR